MLPEVNQTMLKKRKCRWNGHCFEKSQIILPGYLTLGTKNIKEKWKVGKQKAHGIARQSDLRNGVEDIPEQTVVEIICCYLTCHPGKHLVGNS